MKGNFFLLFAVTSIYVIFFFFFPRFSFFHTLEYLWKDSLFLVRGVEEPPPEVVIVAIDEPSFKEINLRWPWPRSLHAQLVTALYKAGAKAIVFDILFTEPSPNPEDDRIFVEALDRAKNVVLGIAFSGFERHGYRETVPVSPLEELAQAAASLGVVNFFPDEDGIIRHGRLQVGEIPSLAAAALMVAGFKERSESCSQTFLIDFKGPGGTIPIVSYYQALSPRTYLPSDFFKDRIVFVGTASEASVEVERGAIDAFPTPYFRTSRKLMFGVEIHAHTAVTLLEGCPLREWPSSGLTNFTVFLGFVLVGLFLKDRPWRLSCFSTLLTIFVFFFSNLLFLKYKIIYTPLSGVSGFLVASLSSGLYAFSRTVRERAFLRRAFSLYVSSELVNEIVKRPEILSLGGKRREISILFADIRNFTSIAERTDPELLTSLLNLYFSRMTKEIFAEKGTLDKFIGDAIMALFGAPVPFKDHAVRACRAALRMARAIEEVSFYWQRAGLSELRIGIGLNSGIAVVGNLGSEQRFDYTAVGDTVNLASRLEGLCKVYGVTIIASEYVFRLARENFYWRELDYVLVKGKTEPIRIYALKEEKTQTDSIYEEGLNFYRKGHFREALSCFERVLAIDGDDFSARLMKERCLYLLKNPPQHWKGVWEIRTK